MTKKGTYQSAAEFVKDVQDGKFKGEVIVDNDCVHAYSGEDMVFDFNDDGPEGALIAVLKALGVNAQDA